MSCFAANSGTPLCSCGQTVSDMTSMVDLYRLYRQASSVRGYPHSVGSTSKLAYLCRCRGLSLAKPEEELLKALHGQEFLYGRHHEDQPQNPRQACSWFSRGDGIRRHRLCPGLADPVRQARQRQDRTGAISFDRRLFPVLSLRRQRPSGSARRRPAHLRQPPERHAPGRHGRSGNRTWRQRHHHPAWPGRAR